MVKSNAESETDVSDGYDEYLDDISEEEMPKAEVKRKKAYEVAI